MAVPKLRIVHETNPRKYFPALFELSDEGVIEIVGEHRYSVVKEWFRSWLRERSSLMQRSKNALCDLLFRFKIPFIKDEIILMGFAPWDWRILLYGYLSKRNKILYHTSWHDWNLDKTPRQNRFFNNFFQRKWYEFIQRSNVKVIAVTQIVSDAVKQQVSVTPIVIPHAVPEIFFTAGKSRSLSKDEVTLKLLYVGEISEKKGINFLLEIMEKVADKNINLTIVGKGPLENVVSKKASNVKYLGAIYDKSKLSSVMAEHDILMLLSQKTQTWEELFGIVIVEALATGCAVIASDHVGPCNIFGGSTMEGLFEQSDDIGIVNKLVELASSKDELKVLFENQNVSNLYSTKEINKKWSEVLKVV